MFSRNKNTLLSALAGHKIKDMSETSLSNIPLKKTHFDVSIASGFVTVDTTKTFRNDGASSIEATMVFPMPVHAVVYGIIVEIDGRKLYGVSKAATEARQSYEGAIEAGKGAVLHEEVIRGIHMLSVGHVKPGSTITVITKWATIASPLDHGVMVAIPTTIGDVYGVPPMADSDTPFHRDIDQTATIKVTAEAGHVTIDGRAMRELAVRPNHPIEIIVSEMEMKPIIGTAHDGGSVTLNIAPFATSTNRLGDLNLLIDASGSMDGPLVEGGETKRQAIIRMVSRAVLDQVFRPDDAGSVFAFGSTFVSIGKFNGKDEIARLIAQTSLNMGGTSTGMALQMTIASSETGDIVLITDGKSYDIDPHAIAMMGRRIHVLLIGHDSLEANVGNLASMTGGQLIFATDKNLDEAFGRIINAARLKIEGADVVMDDTINRDLVTASDGSDAVAAHDFARIKAVKAAIGGMAVMAQWDHQKRKSGKGKKSIAQSSDRAVAAFAANLILRSLSGVSAGYLAEKEGICSHLTSIVMVDDAGDVSNDVPTQVRVPLMSPQHSSMHAGIPSFCRMAVVATANMAPSNVMRSLSTNSEVGELVAYGGSFASAGGCQSLGGGAETERLSQYVTIGSAQSHISSTAGIAAAEEAMRQIIRQGHDVASVSLVGQQTMVLFNKASLKQALGMIDWADVNALSKGDISNQSPSFSSFVTLLADQGAVQFQCSRKEALIAILAWLGAHCTTSANGYLVYTACINMAGGIGEKAQHIFQNIPD
jgi:hypothetical protein